MNSQTPTIKPTANTRENANPKNRFQTLWEQAANIKLKNKQLEENLDKLVLQIKNDVGPIEREFGLSLRKQIDKLIVFAGRKSLSQWQLHVLDEWIEESMSVLQQMGLVDDELTNSLVALQAKSLGIEIDTTSEISAVDQFAAGIEEHLGKIDEGDDDAFYADESEEAEDFMRWYKEQIEQLELEEEHTERFAKRNKSSAADGNSQEASQQPQSVFKTLFHRVARALHPDKESDPKKREIKQGLMSQLLDARRQHDLMQVFQLYQEHVDSNVDFGEQELSELEDVLVQFIEAETQRMHEITMQTPMHELVYSEFFNDDPLKVKKAIVRKIKEIEKRRKEVDLFSKNVSSLVKLKPYLEDRYDQMYWFR